MVEILFRISVDIPIVVSIQYIIYFYTYLYIVYTNTESMKKKDNTA